MFCDRLNFMFVVRMKFLMKCPLKVSSSYKALQPI